MSKKKSKISNGGIVHRGGGRWVMLCGDKEVPLKGYINPAGDYLMSDDLTEAISPARYQALQAGKDQATAVDEAETPEIQPETGGTAEPVQINPAPANVEPGANLSRAQRIERARAERAKRQAEQPGTGWDWAQSL